MNDFYTLFFMNRREIKETMLIRSCLQPFCLLVTWISVKHTLTHLPSWSLTTTSSKLLETTHCLSCQNTCLYTIFLDRLYVTILCNYVSYCPCNSLLIAHYFHSLWLCFCKYCWSWRLWTDKILILWYMFYSVDQKPWPFSILSFWEYYLNDFCILTCLSI